MQNRQADAKRYFPGASKLTAEQLDRLDHCIVEMGKAWDDRFELLRPKFLERYLRGEVSLHLHMRVRTPELNTKQFCAVLAGPDYMASPRLRDELSELVIGHLPRCKVQLRGERHGAGNHDQQSMFVGVGEVIEDSQSVVCRFEFPVRLQSFNDCACGWGEALYYSTLNLSFETVFRE
ncbi:MAG: hypothetical protein ACLPX7_02110, partial [Xanthobacteraceae bacterium]